MGVEVAVVSGLVARLVSQRFLASDLVPHLVPSARKGKSACACIAAALSGRYLGYTPPVDSRVSAEFSVR